MSGAPADVVNDPRVVKSYLAATEDVVARSDLAKVLLGDGQVRTNGRRERADDTEEEEVADRWQQ